MNYELVTGLFAERLSEEVLATDLIMYMGIDTSDEFESLVTKLLEESCSWSVYRVELADSMFAFKSTRGRGFMKRKDMMLLCDEFNITMEELKSNYLEGIWESAISSLYSRFSDEDRGIIFAEGEDNNLLGVNILSLSDELDVNRINLKRALNKYLDAEVIAEYNVISSDADDEEGEFLDWLSARVKNQQLIPWASLPEDVFMFNSEAMNLIKHIEIEVDGALDAMENIDFIRTQLQKLKTLSK